MKYELIQEKSLGESLLYRVFKNRGIEDPNQWYNVGEEANIDPSTITHIQEATRCLLLHIAAEDDAMLNVDADCDGYTSSALLYNWLARNFPDWTDRHLYWALHDDKSHGIMTGKIKEGTKLVLIPDAGSEEYDKHKELKEKGIDTIIIDHHNADHYSEDAIVINNQLDENYPTKSLSGAGMVYKFCDYLDMIKNGDKKFSHTKWIIPYSDADDLLDIAMLGIIADVMSMRDLETRAIIKQGLKNIKNPIIKALVERNSYSIGETPDAMGIAWYVAPAINAITRVGEAEEKEVLFQSFLETKAYIEIPSTKRGHKAGETETIVEQAVRLCNNVKNRQNKIRDSYLEDIRKQIEVKNLLSNRVLVVQVTNAEAGLTGLIANKLMSEYQRPVLLLNKVIDENGDIIWSGSGRNNPLNGVESLQQFCRDSGCVIFAQGHDNAFGIAIADSELESFIKWSNEQLVNVDFTPTYKVDVVYQSNNIDILDLRGVAESSESFGQDISEPLVVIEDINITKEKLHLFKGSTLKIDLGEKISAVKFKSTEEEYNELLPSDMGSTKITIVGRCSLNDWDNSIQLIIEDYNIDNKVQWVF